MIPHEARARAVNASSVRSRLVAAALPFLLLGAAACSRVPGQFEIVQNQVPQAGCLIDTSEMLYRGDGTLDISLIQPGARSAYLAFPLIKNNLAGATGGGPDTNAIDIHSFAIDISASKYGALPANVQALFNNLEQAGPSSPDYALLHFSAPWSAHVSSAGGVVATAVGAFPLELAARVAATGDVGVSRASMVVNARIRAFGSTSTQDLESDPLDFPIYVCAGCLVASITTCPSTTAPANTGNPCNVSQDNYVDCCSSNGSLICPSVVSAP
jgi:hypothetical protein